MSNGKKTGRTREGMNEEERQKRREQFRHYRKTIGLSQAELGQFIGIRKDNVSIIETGGKRGTAPTNQNMAAIRNLLFIYKHGLLPDLLEEINKKN